MRPRYNLMTEPDLLSSARAGDSAAYGELCSRYHSWALNVARKVTRRFEDADIVAEAFTKVLSALRSGKGPTEKFSSYLATAVRNVAASWSARWPEMVMVPVDETVEIPVEVDFTPAGDLGDLAVPFQSLPRRWKQILWLTIIEDLPLADAARVMQISTAAATQLASRARTGLRAAIITVADSDIFQRHLALAPHPHHRHRNVTTQARRVITAGSTRTVAALALTAGTEARPVA